MSTPVTHAVISEKIFNNFFIDKFKKEFFVGALFPDIRLIANIDRNKTHFSDLNLKGIKSKSPFEIGILIHSFIDINRNEYILKSGVYELCPKSKFIEASLKIYEDIIFYQELKDWRNIIGYFDNVLEEESLMGISTINISKWHKTLQEYFSNEPNIDSIRTFAFNIGYNESIVENIMNDIESLKKNKKVDDILRQMFNSFDLINI